MLISSGIPPTQKLRSHLPRRRGFQRFSAFMLGAGSKIDSHASPTANRILAFVVSD